MTTSVHNKPVERRSALDPRAARALLEARRQPKAELTQRESEVLGTLAGGMSNKQIARALSISEKTVKTHLTRIYAQIGVGDRVQAAVWAQSHRELWRRSP
ncbi:MAG: response regulator transcription factor [Actinomycetota bacterium]|nr:response regulator transcription factor [Actinomycetota bacterium]